MALTNGWRFASFDDFAESWFTGKFDCESIASFTDPIVLDWCSRLEDWAPQVAVCFNKQTSAVTLDRISQHEMPELRRLVCFHSNTSVQTLQRLLLDQNQLCRESAQEALEKRAAFPSRFRAGVAGKKRRAVRA